jgi:GT2 family glycosyltransferase
MKTKTLISILNWNGADKTEGCLRSLGDAGYLSRGDVKVVVTDNASALEDLELLRRLTGVFKFSLVENSVNVGFASGHNAVIRCARDEGFSFVWLLNNDATVIPGALEALLDLMVRDAKCACAAPLLIDSVTDEVYFSGATHSWTSLMPTWLPTGRFESVGATDPKEVWSVGTANLLRLSALDAVGLMEDSYFAYFEDDELGERILQSGWQTRFAPEARVKHDMPDASAGKRRPFFYYLWFRNQMRFFHRYAPSHGVRWTRLRLLARCVDSAGSLAKAGYLDQANAALLGACDALRGIGGAPVLGRKLPKWFTLVCYALQLLNALHGVRLRER